MTRTVFCTAPEEAEALGCPMARPARPARARPHRQSLNEWLAHQTILINEYRLTARSEGARLPERRWKNSFGEGRVTSRR